ncbi:MAG: flagellar biosynthesis anti-sigma factor FlgM [Sporolactobacillus sp.]|jgi:negative regulator of flagellin synthesis FlgM|nr:flagellar biosynthesis anti-sigma factor FlgM [Sporolactobacillus sp.]
MKIERYQPLQPYQAYGHLPKGETNPDAAAKDDKVEISEAARRMQNVRHSEETQQKKIDRLKAQVEAGTYHVPAEKIADKMIEYWKRK